MKRDTTKIVDAGDVWHLGVVQLARCDDERIIGPGFDIARFTGNVDIPERSGVVVFCAEYCLLKLDPAGNFEIVGAIFKIGFNFVS